MSEDFEIIPETLEAISLFLKVQTQWRVDSGYLIGLDYNVLFRLMDIEQIRNEKKTELLGDIQTIEAKVIEILSERSK